MSTTLVAFLLLACNGTARRPVPSPQPIPDEAALTMRPAVSVPLGLAAGQFQTVPVTIDDQHTVAVLDTGIGLALVSKALCDRIGCTIDGEFTGKRMSGQEVTLPTTMLARLTLGGVTVENVVAAVVDIDGFFPDPEIEAFVGLPFFRDQPFTIDGPESRLILETAESLADRERTGTSAPLRLAHHGVALDTFVSLSLGEGEVAEMLMDTGSRVMVLHPRYAEPLGIDLSDDALRRDDGKDETGEAFTRTYVELPGAVAFAAVPTLERRGENALFQEIIYDGLVGKEFLASFVLTWDLAQERLLIAE